MQPIFSLTLLGLLLTAMPAFARGATRTPVKPPASPTATHALRVAYGEAASVWADVELQVKDLAVLVRERRLDEVHPVAFEIRDLVRTLPDKSRSLSAVARKKLESHIRIIDRLAEQLDRYADAGKYPETVRQHKAMLSALGTIKALFPTGALSIAAAPATSKDRLLYLTPGGAYTEADIAANGNQLPAVKFRSVKVSHDLRPAVGDRICPITLTKANPGLSWVIAGKEYVFCCPPCLEEYLALVKKDPRAIKPPEEFVKKAQ